MRQNAVSSAPQNAVPTHRLATMAMMPTVVEESRTSRSASDSVVSVALGKRSWRSTRTERSSSGEERIWPVMKRAISATGKIDSRRL